MCGRQYLPALDSGSVGSGAAGTKATLVSVSGTFSGVGLSSDTRSLFGVGVSSETGSLFGVESGMLVGEASD